MLTLCAHLELSVFMSLCDFNGGISGYTRHSRPQDNKTTLFHLRFSFCSLLPSFPSLLFALFIFIPHSLSSSHLKQLTWLLSLWLLSSSLWSSPFFLLSLLLLLLLSVCSPVLHVIWLCVLFPRYADSFYITGCNLYPLCQLSWKPWRNCQPSCNIVVIYCDTTSDVIILYVVM